MTKIASIQMLRGIAALMVVAFHALSIQGKYLPGVDLLPEILEVGQTGVDLFFVISGFVMVASSHDKRGLKSAGFFLRDRFLRIYPVYWFYFSLLLVVFLVRPDMINSSQGGQVDLLRSFALFPSETLPLLLVAWTLTHELWFYMVFALILLLPGALRISMLFAWLAMVVCYSFFGEAPESPVIRVVVHAFTIEFILGSLAAYVYLRIRVCSNLLLLILLLVTVVSLSVAVGAAVADGSNVIATVSLDRAFLYGGGYAALVLLLVLGERRGVFEGIVLLKKLGDMSYSLYLSHVLVLSFCSRVWLHFQPVDGVLGGVIFWVVTFSIAVVSAYFAYVFIEKPILRNTLYRFRGDSIGAMKTPTLLGMK